MHCTPSAQGPVDLKYRLPASLGSLKPAVFSHTWDTKLGLEAAGEPEERAIMESLISELNEIFDVGLDSNFSTARDIQADLEDINNNASRIKFIVLGSSHDILHCNGLECTG